MLASKGHWALEDCGQVYPQSLYFHQGLSHEHEISVHPYALRQEQYQYHSRLHTHFHPHHFVLAPSCALNLKWSALKEELELAVEEVEVLIEPLAPLWG